MEVNLAETCCRRRYALSNKDILLAGKNLKNAHLFREKIKIIPVI